MSPDEITLVETAAIIGFKYMGTSGDQIKLEVMNHHKILQLI